MLSETAALEQERVARLTSEMTKAIKRQESNSGLDYWRAGGLNTAGFIASDKRPTYKKVTQINLNFPGAFLPNVNNGPPVKPKKKDQPASAVVLTRSRTSLEPTISSNTRTQGNNSGPITPASRKAMVTDLTCLQLADTLFSSKKSPYAGILNLWPGRSRYTDYFTDRKETNNDDNSTDNLSDLCMSGHRKQSAAIPSQRGISIPVLHYKTLPVEEEIIQYNNDIARDNLTELDSRSEGSTIVVNISNSKPQKSILKNGISKKYLSKNNTGSASLKDCGGSTISTCSYKLPTTNKFKRQGSAQSDNCVTLDKITPVLKPSGSRPSSNRSDSYANADNESSSRSMVQDLTSRKRSVRFNVRNEIREYAPCEPITHC